MAIRLIDNIGSIQNKKHAKDQWEVRLTIMPKSPFVGVLYQNPLINLYYVALRVVSAIIPKQPFEALGTRTFHRTHPQQTSAGTQIQDTQWAFDKSSWRQSVAKNIQVASVMHGQLKKSAPFPVTLDELKSLSFNLFVFQRGWHVSIKDSFDVEMI